MEQVMQAVPLSAAVPNQNEEAASARRLERVLNASVAALGLMVSWTNRFQVSPDSISYLDMGDALFRGDWRNALTGLWSPLYGWLLGAAMFVTKPSPAWEFPVAHAVNWLVFLVCLASFRAFLRQAIAYREFSAAPGAAAPSPTAWLVFGYGLFAWSSLDLIGVEELLPDMLVAAALYSIGAIVLRMQRTATRSWGLYILLGAVMGVAYWVKAAMLPAGGMFLVALALSVRRDRGLLVRTAVAAAAMAIVATPLIAALSLKYGRVTMSDAGNLNYMWKVNRLKSYAHWQEGQNPENGSPIHPTRQLLSEPAVYEFAEPVGGTYPALFDPSYWYEGAHRYFDLRQQIARVVTTAKVYFNIVFPAYQTSYLTVRGADAALLGFLALVLLTGQRWDALKAMWRKWWLLLLPSAGAMAMYTVVHVDPRYVGGFIVLCAIGAFAGIETPRPLSGAVSAVMLAVGAVLLFGSAAPRIMDGYAEARSPQKHVHWEVAKGLQALGVQPGDQVAYIQNYGRATHAFWARLARARLVVEVPMEPKGFWDYDISRREAAMSAIRSTDARFAVADRDPELPGWKPVGDTGYFAIALSN